MYTCVYVHIVLSSPIWEGHFTQAYVENIAGSQATVSNVSKKTPIGCIYVYVYMYVCIFIAALP